jgi:hypothetical protein
VIQLKGASALFFCEQLNTVGRRLMEQLDKKTELQIHQSLVAEAAKARNEINCAQRDIAKANSRLEFLLVLTNNLIDRTKD